MRLILSTSAYSGIWKSLDFFFFSTSAHCFAKQLSTVKKKGDHFRDSQTQTPTLANDKMQWYLTRSDRMRTFLDGFDVVTSGAICQ